MDAGDNVDKWFEIEADKRVGVELRPLLFVLVLFAVKNVRRFCCHT